MSCVPPFTRILQLTRLRVLFLLTLSVTSSCLIVWHLASAIPSNTNTVVTPGSFQRACDYNIFNDGTNLFATDKTGDNKFKETTMQAIITDTLASNTVDCIASGSYTSWGTTYLTVNQPGFTVQGSGKSRYSTIIAPSGELASPDAWFGFIFVNANNFTIANLVLDGACCTTTPAMSILGSNFLMQNVQVRNGFTDTGIGDAIFVNGNNAGHFGSANLRNIRFLENEFNNIQAISSAIAVYDSSSTTSTDFMFQGNFFHEDQGGSITFDNSQGSKSKVNIVNNIFKNNGLGTPGAANFGDVFDQQRINPMNQVVVTGNIFFQDNAAAKALAVGIYNSVGVEITANTMYAPSDNYNPAIALGYSSGNNIFGIDGVTVSGNTIWGYNKACDCDATINAVWSGNTFAFAQAQELGMYGMQKNVLVEGNEFFNANTHNWAGGANAVNETAISIFSIDSSLTITGNMFLDNRTSHQMLYGILTQGSNGQPDYLVVTNNQFNVTTPLVTNTGNWGPHNVVTGNWNFNPFGKLSFPFNNVAGGFSVNAVGMVCTSGQCGLSVTNPTASITYTVVTSDLILTSSGGTGVAIIIKDNSGNTIINGVATVTAQWLPRGWTLNFGAFSVVPSITVDML